MAVEKRIAKKNTPKRHRADKPTSASKSLRSPQRWSAHVTETSDALDLKHHVFASEDPSKIARSLKRSAERSKRRKGTPFQSAMSMLTFYINRAGKNLTSRQLRTLDRAKNELRKA